jgi:iron complex transport system substrate-binding protein
VAALQRRLIWLATAAAILVASGFDQADRAVAQASAPQRIVSLVPATTEMLFAMSAGGRVIGVGTYDHFPPAVEGLPRLGGLLDPNVEQLIALRPDLVVVYDSQTELRQQLGRSRIPVWTYSIGSLSDVTAAIRSLGDRVGLHAEADGAARRVETGLASVRSRAAGRQKPRVLLLFGREPGSLRGINASGGYGFLHDLLELAGGTDVLADVKQAAVSMSTEMVLARRPDVIIELHDGEAWAPDRGDVEQRAWNALPSVPAVRNRRIYQLTGGQFVVPGPRVVEAAEAFERTLHPDGAR